MANIFEKYAPTARRAEENREGRRRRHDGGREAHDALAVAHRER